MPNLTLYCGSRSIVGALAGKSVYCSFRPAAESDLPAPGEYHLEAPVADPVYGTVAMLVPAARRQDPMAKLMGGIESPVKKLMGGIESPVKKGMGGIESPVKKLMGAEGGAQAFYVSARPVFGAKSLVLEAGHADLMDLLRGSGGASVTVV